MITTYILYNDETLPTDLGCAIRSLKTERVTVKPWYNNGTITDGVRAVIADCTTPWFSFVDSDDISVAGIYEKLAQAITAHVDFVYCQEIVANVMTGAQDPGWASSENVQGLIRKEPYLRYFWDYTNNRLAHHRGIFRTAQCKNFVPDTSVPDIFIQGQLISHIQKGKIDNVARIEDVGYIWRIHGANSTLKYLKGKDSSNG